MTNERGITAFHAVQANSPTKTGDFSDYDGAWLWVNNPDGENPALIRAENFYDLTTWTVERDAIDWGYSKFRVIGHYASIDALRVAYERESATRGQAVEEHIHWQYEQEEPELPYGYSGINIAGEMLPIQIEPDEAIADHAALEELSVQELMSESWGLNYAERSISRMEDLLEHSTSCLQAPFMTYEKQWQIDVSDGPSHVPREAHKITMARIKQELSVILEQHRYFNTIDSIPSEILEEALEILETTVEEIDAEERFGEVTGYLDNLRGFGRSGLIVSVVYNNAASD